MNPYLVAAAGVGLGLAARLVDDVAPRWVGNVGAVWFLAAFLAGRSRRNPRAGAAMGALCLIAACVSYYAWRVAVDGTISLRYLSTVGLLWLLASVAVGSIGGAFGALSRTISSSWGIPAGVFAGEAAAVLFLRQRWIQVVVEAIVAIVLLGRARFPRGVRVAAVTAVLVAAIGVSYRLLLR